MTLEEALNKARQLRHHPNIGRHHSIEIEYEYECYACDAVLNAKDGQYYGSMVDYPCISA
jgi:hypothetical protein